MKKKIVRVGKNVKINGLHYCGSHSGKMAGMCSLSTSCTNNSRCLENIKNGNSICAKCFAFSQMDRYKNMIPCYEENTNILTSRILSDEEIPEIQHIYFRFESFGDLNNIIQVANYFKIASFNKNVNCALWTKNPDIIENAINTLDLVKPENMIIIYSDPIENASPKEYIDTLLKKYPFIDKVFTVYENEEKAALKNAKINCGARSCLTCGRCYKKETEKFINELEK